MGKFEDLTGRRFGKLVVLGLAEDYISPKGCIIKQWECQCNCGNKTIVRRTDLKRKNANIISCGCARKKIKDISGRKFGKLTALERVGRKNGRTFWKCKCDCGKEHIVDMGSLTTGAVKSCGCISTRSDPLKYEAVTGNAVSKGNKVIFLDNDKCNISKENMVVVSKKVYEKLHYNNLFYSDAELKKTAIEAYKLDEKVREMEKNL